MLVISIASLPPQSLYHSSSFLYYIPLPHLDVISYFLPSPIFSLASSFLHDLPFFLILLMISLIHSFHPLLFPSHPYSKDFFPFHISIFWPPPPPILTCCAHSEKNQVLVAQEPMSHTSSAWGLLPPSHSPSWTCTPEATHFTCRKRLPRPQGAEQLDQALASHSGLALGHLPISHTCRDLGVGCQAVEDSTVFKMG